MGLSNIIIRLFKKVVPPHELMEMLHRWFGKGEQEIKQLMAKHGFSEDHVKELWEKSGLSSVTGIIEKEVTSVLPEVIHEVVPEKISNEISREMVQTLANRLRIKGLNHTAIMHLLSSCGFTEKELGHIMGTETRDLANPKPDGKVLVFNPQPDTAK